MKRYLIGILVCLATVFCLNEITGKTVQNSQERMAVSEQHADEIGLACQLSSNSKQDAAFTNERFSFEGLDAVNLSRNDTSFSPTSSYRGSNPSRSLKFISTILMLSFHDTPLMNRDTKNLYYHYSFVKSSCQYFIYTLRKIVI